MNTLTSVINFAASSISIWYRPKKRQEERGTGDSPVLCMIYLTAHACVAEITVVMCQQETVWCQYDFFFCPAWTLSSIILFLAYSWQRAETLTRLCTQVTPSSCHLLENSIKSWTVLPSEHPHSQTCSLC